MIRLGDYAEDATLDFFWNTSDAAGASVDRTTDGEVRVYKGNSTTQTTTGVTDDEAFDGLVGVHHCRIVLTDAFYVAGEDYSVVLSAATIDGEVVNAAIAHFSIANRSSVAILQKGIAQTAASLTITLATTASTVIDFYNDNFVQIVGGTGAGQSRRITDYSSGTRIATIIKAWSTIPDSTSRYQVVSILGLSPLDTEDTVWDATDSDHSNFNTTGEALFKINQLISEQGSVSGSPTDTVFDTNLDSSTDDFYNGMQLIFYTGSNAGLSRRISDYVGSTNTVTVANAFPFTAEGSFYLLGMEHEAPAAGSQDWTSGEREQIRHRYGIDGTKTAPASTSIPSMPFLLEQGLAQAGAATTITLRAGAEATDDYFNDLTVMIIDGTGAGQARLITDYDGATRVATVDTWVTNPDSTSDYQIIPGLSAGGGGAADWTTTERENIRFQLGVNGIQTAPTSNVPNLAIQATVDTIETDTDEIQSKLPDNNMMGSSVTTDKDDEIDAIKAKTDGLNFTGTELDANMVQVSGDASAADNIEATYDGTGYEDDVAPAQQQQVRNISNTGGAINTSAISATITVGVETGTFADTVELDGVEHLIEDTAGEIDMEYGFEIPSDASPSSVTLTGRVNNASNSLDVFAFNFGTSTFEQIGNVPGKGPSVNDELTFSLLVSHVGTGVDLGKVRVQFQNTGIAGADFFVDRIFLSFAVIVRSAGYSNGDIWVDTVGGTAGTTPFINGTADNAVDSLADAITLSNSLNMKRFRLSSDSSIILSQNFDDFTFTGDHWTLDLNGQSISDATISSAFVSGTCTGVNNPFFQICHIEDVTLPGCHLQDCSLEGTIILADAESYFVDNCYAGVTGGLSPVFDFNATVGTTRLNLRHYSGPVEVQNMGQVGSDVMGLDGNGALIINANCVGGTIFIRGNFTILDNSGGAVTIFDDARFTLTGVWDHLLTAITTVGSIGKLIKDFLDATITSRASQTSVDTVDSNVDLIVAKLPSGDISDFDELTDPVELLDSGGSAGTSASELVDDVWNAAVRSLTAFSTTLALSVWDVLLANILIADTVGLAAKINIDAKISERATQTSVDVIDGNVDSILVDTNEMQTKLPTNNIMGSSVKTDKDDEIDAILTDTSDMQPRVVAIEIDTDEMQGKLPTNNIMGSSVKTDKDDEIDAILTDTADMQPRIVAIEIDTDEIQSKLPSGTISDFDETTDPVELLDSGGSAGTSAEELIDDVWDEVLTGATHNVQNSSGKILRELKEGLGIEPGTAQAGGTATITLQSDESSFDDFFNEREIAIVANTGIGQLRTIIDYNGTTKVATVHRDWEVTPDATSDYVIAFGAASVPASDSLNTIRDAIVNDATRFAGADIGSILSDTNETQGKLPDNNIMGSGVTTDKDDEIDAILVDTADMQPRVVNIETDTNEMQGKLPANFIMGSSVTTDKDDEIDAILADTSDMQPRVAAIEIDTNEIQGKLPDNNIMGSGVTTDKDDEIDAILADTNEIQGKLPSGTISDFEETTDPVEILDTGGSAGTSASELVDDTWREPLADHSGVAGSMAEALDAADAVADKDAIADAVWDELLSAHTDAGSASEFVTLIKKVLFNRFKHDGTVIRLFDDDDTLLLTGQVKNKDGNVIDSADFDLSTPAERSKLT